MSAMSNISKGTVNSINIINSVCANRCTVVVVRSCPIYSLLLNDISSLLGNGNQCNGSYILMMGTDVSNKTLYLPG